MKAKQYLFYGSLLINLWVAQGCAPPESNLSRKRILYEIPAAEGAEPDTSVANPDEKPTEKDLEMTNSAISEP